MAAFRNFANVPKMLGDDQRTNERAPNIWKADYKENILICKRRGTLQNKKKEGSKRHVTI